MPSVNLSYVNIALNSFGFIVAAIIFFVCLSEWIDKKTGSVHFLILLAFLMISLVGDTISRFGESKPELRTMTMISNTVASCAIQLSVICFMEFLRQTSVFLDR